MSHRHSNEKCTCCHSKHHKDNHHEKGKLCDDMDGCLGHGCVKYYKYLHDRCGKISASLCKTADPISYTKVGDCITYSYKITNTGDISIESSIKICDDKLGEKRIHDVCIKPGRSKTFTMKYVIKESDMMEDCITNTAKAYIKIDRKEGICTRKASTTIQNDSEAWDYIISGLGTAGSIIARLLSNNKRKRVLVLERGKNMQNDPVVLNPSWLENGNTLAFSPKYASTCPISVDFLVALIYSEGFGAGGGGMHNFMLSARGTKRIYDLWAAISGNPMWKYSNILPLMKSLETYTPYGSNFNIEQRGSKGPINVTQGYGVTGNSYLEQFTKFSNSSFFYDYNVSPQGDCCISPGQQFITPPAPAGTNRSYSFKEFLPIGVIIDENGNGLDGRKLKIIFNAKTLKFNTRNSSATSVEYILGDNPSKVLNARLKSTGKLILSAGSINSPKILMNSGIGNAADLEKVGIPVVLNSPNVGKNLQCQYGPTAVVAGKGAGTMPFVAEIFTDGSSRGITGGITGGINDNIRRTQIINFAASADSFASLLTISNPQSRGSLDIVSDNPLTDPKVNMNFYTGGFTGVTGSSGLSDAELVVIFFKQTKAAAEAAGLTMIFPPPEDYKSDEKLLEDASDPSNFTIQYHIVGTAKMGTNISNGVVDGNLHVFGLNNVMIGDNSIQPETVENGTCFSAYYIGTMLCKILGVPLVV